MICTFGDPREGRDCKIPEIKEFTVNQSRKGDLRVMLCQVQKKWRSDVLTFNQRNMGFMRCTLSQRGFWAQVGLGIGLE